MANAPAETAANRHRVGIGVPIAFGVALYILLETVDLLWFLSTPIRRLSAAAGRR
jgi:hypothetical protein